MRFTFIIFDMGTIDGASGTGAADVGFHYFKRAIAPRLLFEAAGRCH